MSIDPDGKYIDKICMTVARSIHPYPFIPAMTPKQLDSLEKEIKSNLKSMSALTGVFYSLATMPKDVQQLLQREDFFFNNDNKFHASAGLYHHWPIGINMY